MIHSMDTMMKEVAKLSLQEELEKMAGIDEDSMHYLSLSEMQIQLLAKKIGVMPLEYQNILLLWYCFEQESSEIEEVLGVTQIEEKLKYVNKLLSRRLGLNDSWIEEESMEEACKQALIQMMRGYRHMKAVRNPQYSREFREKLKGIQIRKSPATLSAVISKRIAAAMLISALGFSALLAVNGEAREKFLGWVVEVFSEFTIFDRKGDEENRDFSQLEKFHFNYIPTGYWLEDIKEGNSVRIYEYVNENKECMTIRLFISPEGMKTYFNTEGVEVEETIVRGLQGYVTQNDTSSSLLWYEDGIEFLLYGKLSREEIVKIAENIVKESESLK